MLSAGMLWLLCSICSFVCCDVAETARSTSNRFEANMSISETLDELFKKTRYDPRVRPNVNGDPVDITIGFWVLSIDSVSVTDMAFGLEIFLRQGWVDKRLEHGMNQTLSLSNRVLSNMWLPDTYFTNAKQSSFHEVTTKNLMIRIGPKGEVHYNARVTLKASCVMDLRLYPFDVQSCPLIMESYGYSSDHVTYRWEREEEDGMMFIPKDVRILPQFKLVDLQIFTRYNQYVVGNWSGVIANFSFERTYSFYMIHIYGPSALIVVLSWISFLLPREQAPARVTLGVTSVLTEVTILTMSNHAMPRVNYVKAIDKYLITCFLFVFASLMEYALVLFFVMKQNQHYKNSTKKQLGRSKTQAAAPNPSRKLITSSTHKGRSTWDGLRDWLFKDKIIASIDEISQMLFPLSFALFNVYYWLCLFKFPHLIISKL